MKRKLYITIFTVLILSSLIAAVSCGTSSTPTPGGNLTIQPTQPGATPGPDFTPAPTAEVIIENYAYSPATLRVATGTTVTWTNKDSIQHTATTRTSLFDSGLFSRGQSFSYTFNLKGDYEYYCVPHPYMTGKVVVQ